MKRDYMGANSFKFIAVIMVLLYSYSGQSQFLETYERKPQVAQEIITAVCTDGQAVYMAGYSLRDPENFGFKVKKVDAQGNIQWTTHLSIPVDHVEDHWFVEDMYISADGFLYGLVSVDIERKHSFKIDPFTGEEIYTFGYSPGMVTQNMSDFQDFNSFLSAYTVTFTFNNQSFGQHIFFLQQGTGSAASFVVGSLDRGDIPWCLSVESNQDSYFNFGNEIRKVRIDFTTNVQHWATTLDSDFDSGVQKMYLDSVSNKLYLSGRLENSNLGYIACLDSDTGNTNWYEEYDLGHQDNLGAMEVGENSIFLAWNSLDSTQNNSDIVFQSVAKTTGAVNWQKSNDLFAGLEGYQGLTQITIDPSAKIWAAGFCGSVNSGAAATGLESIAKGIWTTVQFDEETGDLLHTTFSGSSAPNSFSSQGASLALFNIDDQIIDIGSQLYLYNQPASFLLNINSNDLTQTTLHPTADHIDFPSTSISAAQFSDGEIILGKSFGIESVLILQDDLGNENFRTTIPIDQGAFKLSSIDILDNRRVLIGGKYHQSLEDRVDDNENYEGYLSMFIFDRQSRTFTPQITSEDVIQFSETSNSFYDEYYDIFFIATNNDHNSNYSILSIDTSNLEMHSTIGFLDSRVDPNPNTRVICNTPNYYMFGIYNNEIRVYPKYILGYGNATEISGVEYFNHISKFDTEGCLLSGKNNAGNPLITYVEYSSNPAANGEVSIPIIGEGLKWIFGENTNIIYLLSQQDNNNIWVSKINWTNKEILWSTEITTDEIGGILCQPNISFNEKENFLVLTGSAGPFFGNKKLFISFLDSEGTVKSRFTKNGNAPSFYEPENAVRSNINHTASGVIMLGGNLKIDDQRPSAFTYYFNGNDLAPPITGQIFYDSNFNGTQEIDEPNMNIGKLNIDENYYSYIDFDGGFQLLLDQGSHTIRHEKPTNWIATSDSIVNIEFDLNSTQDTIRFGIFPANSEASIEPFFNASPYICNEQTSIAVNIKNTGTTQQYLKYKLDYFGEYNGAGIPEDSLTSESAYFNIGTLFAGQFYTNGIAIIGPDASQLGDTLYLKLTAYVVDSLSGVTLDSFTYDYSNILLCSYDPNDKAVNPIGVGSVGYTLFDQPLDYTIRFQNTGNFRARNVRIVDTLDSDLDLSTFKLQAASHPLTEVRLEENVVQFIFNNIYLPDSTNNEPESHGFISYRIAPISGLSENTSIENTAHIYFDLNPAIVTNTTLSTLVSQIPTSTQNINATPAFVLFPNPTSSTIELRNLQNIKGNFEIFAVDGKRIHQGILAEKVLIDLSQYEPGVYYLRIKSTETILKIVRI